MTSTPRVPEGNELLAALPPMEQERLRGHWETVTLQPDDVLAQPGERIRYVYFPLDSVICLLTEVDRHEALGVALIGSEGLLGASLVLGDDRWPLRARVPGAGGALRMEAAEFQHALPATPTLESRLRLYLRNELAQLAQTAACASFHGVETRLAYWLLMLHDRAHGDRFYQTHDRMGHMLGVRRSGVSTAAGILQGRKLIRYTRGHIAVLNRRGLEQAACGCYRALRQAYRQIAPSSAGVSRPGYEDVAPRAPGVLTH